MESPASLQLSSTPSSSPGLRSPLHPKNMMSPERERTICVAPDPMSSTSCVFSPPRLEHDSPSNRKLKCSSSIASEGTSSSPNIFSRKINYDFTMHEGLSEASSSVASQAESEEDKQHQLLNMQEAMEKSTGDRLKSRRSLQQIKTWDSLLDVTPQPPFFNDQATPIVQTSFPSSPFDCDNAEETRETMKDDVINSCNSSNDEQLQHAKSSEQECSSTYSHLQVSDEILELFQYIDRFKPQDVEIGTLLKPFIPDYIPAVGAIDEFLKVPRPDNVPDYLGLKVLDESGPKQSDPGVVTLQLRAASMQTSKFPIQVMSLENATQAPKKIDAWIQSIKELHRTKPPPAVIYSKSMPDIQKLTEEWPPQIEKVLGEIELPSAKLDVDISTFCDICCTILDIPVYRSRVESLHLLFSLYLEFKNESQEEKQIIDWASRY